MSTIITSWVALGFLIEEKDLPRLPCFREVGSGLDDNDEFEDNDNPPLLTRLAKMLGMEIHAFGCEDTETMYALVLNIPSEDRSDHGSFDGSKFSAGTHIRNLEKNMKRLLAARDRLRALGLVTVEPMVLNLWDIG